MRPHVSAETLARYRQGDLSPGRSARIGAHLNGCARCGELNEDLGGVTTLLASVHPPPIPADLTARIQSALATEAAQIAAQRVAVPAGSKAAAAAAEGWAAGREGPAGAGGPRGRSVPGGPGRRGLLGRLPTASPKFVLSAAAAAVVILGVGTFAIVQSGSTHSSGTSASSAAGSPAFRSPAAARGPALRYSRAGQQASVTPVLADTNFTAGRLSAQVAAAMTRFGSAAGPLSAPMTGSATRSNAQAQNEPAPTFGSRAVAALQGCVNRIAAGDLVVLVEVARFQGSPATIIVTEVPDITPRQVWVVGPGCSASRSDVLRHSELSAG
jgi:hypothetical protein